MRTILASSLLLFVLSNVGLAAEWATLRGRIVFDGTRPVPKPVTVDKDVEYCGKCNLVDESLMVNPTNHGVKDVVVKLALNRGETTEVHESYKKDETGEVLLDNTKCRFEPHVIVLRTTQTLVIRNSDPIGNNVRIDPIKNTAINVTIPTGTTHVQKFPKVERMPARVSCSIHSWELGWLVITDHPYVTVTDSDGRFEIKNLPAGKLSFMFWHEKAGYLADVTFQGKTQSWRRGTKEFDLKPGENDLGEIVVQPSLFEH